MSQQFDQVYNKQLDKNMFTLNDALAHVGDSHRYQVRVFLILAVVSAVSNIQIMGATYLYIQPPLLCDGAPCDFDKNDCSNFKSLIPAPNFPYSNIVTEYQLYCDQEVYSTIAMSMTALGSIVGGTTTSFLGDRFGRRKAYILSWGIATVGMIGILSSFSIGWLIVMSFIVGFGQIGSYILMIVIINEVCGERSRQKFTVGQFIVWSVVEIFSAAIYYGIPNWRLAYGIFVVMPAILSFISLFWIQETPKFYISKGRKQEAVRVLDYIGQVNGRGTFTEYIPQISYIDPQIDQTVVVNAIDQPKNKFSYKHLFYYKSLRAGSFGFMLVSFSLHIIYYGDQFGLKDISEGDMVYVMGAAIGLAELIGNIIMRYSIKKVLRKKAIILSFIASILCCSLFMFYGFSSDATILNCNYCLGEIFVIILACLIRIFNSFGFALQGIYANEFYPTPIRSIGSGFVYAAGIAGSFVSPYVIFFSDIVNINPYFLIGILGLLGPLGTVLIGETFGQPLKDTIAELTISEKKSELELN